MLVGAGQLAGFTWSSKTGVGCWLPIPSRCWAEYNSFKSVVQSRLSVHDLVNPTPHHVPQARQRFEDHPKDNLYATYIVTAVRSQAAHAELTLLKTVCFLCLSLPGQSVSLGFRVYFCEVAVLQRRRGLSHAAQPTKQFAFCFIAGVLVCLAQVMSLGFTVRNPAA